MGHKINTDSWHYKLIMRYLSEPPKSLCVYPYTVIFFMALTAVIIAVLCTVAFLACYAVVTPLLVMFDVMDMSWKTNVSAVFVTIASVYIGFVLFHSYYKERIRVYKYKKYYEKYGGDAIQEAKQPNIVLAYLKAKKEKICPKIEYV
tara:strand:- start:759 stop:1199 length:441 start_codon:yes stop_codon:yes gene_type:complete